MPIKQYNPTTPARRGMTSQDLSDVTTRKHSRASLRLVSRRLVAITLVKSPFGTVVVASSGTTACLTIAWPLD